MELKLIIYCMFLNDFIDHCSKRVKEILISSPE